MVITQAIALALVARHPGRFATSRQPFVRAVAACAMVATRTATNEEQIDIAWEFCSPVFAASLT
jgi:hypothetical protein